MRDWPGIRPDKGLRVVTCLATSPTPIPLVEPEGIRLIHIIHGKHTTTPHTHAHTYRQTYIHTHHLVYTPILVRLSRDISSKLDGLYVMKHVDETQETRRRYDRCMMR